ncbi:Fungal-trans domain-containing protein [Fusarium sp. LHS14.1]|nr:Fungal-trans domain-containing protein [Fusarium sp. LHS14.1]
MSDPRARAPFCQSEALFSSYPFLALDDLSGLTEQDVQFLELNGCFHLPLRPIQEEFVHQYFLYIHPCYPLMDEGEFWSMYLDRDRRHGKEKTMSLLLLQAMLFASSAFVSPAVLKNAGYSGVKVARGIFYRRAKLLFDFGVESDPFTKAQAALLLTFQFSAAEPHAGSLWLSTGIQNAIVAQTHAFQAPGSSTALKRRNKRLWWSLYWRDRVLTLGLRKPLQITPSSFNVQLDLLTQDDLIDEAHHSFVYDPKTKRHLTDILTFQCRLGILLTEVLALTYGPSSFDPTYSLDHFEATLSQMRTARARLARWKEDAEAAFYVFLGDGHTHRSLTLFSSLIYIYAYAAQIALGNHEALIIERMQKGVTLLDDSALRSIGEELTHATTETTRLVRLIVKQGLTQHLPISVIAYIAFPLMLSSLDDKISSDDAQTESDRSLTKYHAQAMHLCSKRFEGAEDISRMISQILHSAPIQLPIRVVQPRQSNQGKGPNGNSGSSGSKKMGRRWDEIFVTRLYMRLRLSLDYALVTGKPPTEADLPSYILQGATKRLNLGPVHSLSSAILGTSPGSSAGSIDNNPRVVELDDKSQDGEADTNMTGAQQDSAMPDAQTAVQAGERARILRSSWEYDPIWAANLFDEMNDVLWS